MQEAAESKGYSVDLCAYARTNFGFLINGSAENLNMPKPDFVCCCNNICSEVVKWYENISRELNIPLIMIDTPYNNEYEVSESRIKYFRGQFEYGIKQLEEISGKKFDPEKLSKVMEISSENGKLWKESMQLSKDTYPSPMNGFDLFTYMAIIVCYRGKKETTEAFKLLIEELKQNAKEGKTTFRGEEKYRIMFEGIACWPWLRATATGLKSRGINMVTTIYADAFGFIYDDFDGMCRAYANVPNCMNIEHARDKRTKLCKDNSVEGLLVHTNRSCKLWSGFMSEMSRQIGEECGIPVVSFDGDQADPRNFSEAQYDTRVQGLTEIMEANKEI